MRDPDRKGKVESASATRRRRRCEGMRFESLEEAQAYLDRWERRWADTRIHGTTKRQVAAMFAEEKPALLPLPRRAVPLLPVRRAHRASGRLRRGRRRLLRARRRAGSAQRLPVQWDEQLRALLDPRTGQLLREHSRQERGRYRTPDEDQPQRTPPDDRSSSWLAPRMPGSTSDASAARSIAQMAELGVRRILGVLALAKKYGVATVEDACAAALGDGRPDLPLRAPLPGAQPRPPLTLRQVDPLIRQLTQYRDLIEPHDARRTIDMNLV